MIRSMNDVPILKMRDAQKIFVAVLLLLLFDLNCIA